MKKVLTIMLALSTVILSQAQTLLTLEECRDMAVKASRDLNQADLERQMAGYDKQIARASYFPNVSALGGYIHNSRDIALISDTQSQMLTNAGTLVQNSLNQAAAGAAGQGIDPGPQGALRVQICHWRMLDSGGL